MVLCAKKHQVTCCTCQLTKQHHNLILQRLQDKFGEFIYLVQTHVHICMATHKSFLTLFWVLEYNTAITACDGFRYGLMVTGNPF